MSELRGAIVASCIWCACYALRKRYMSRMLVSEHDFDAVDVAAPAAEQAHGVAPRRLRKAETVLRSRTQRVVIVVERCCDDRNAMAVLRTAEAMGIQNVWFVMPKAMKNAPRYKKITKQSLDWLSTRTFDTTAECIAAIRAEKRQLWVTDLSQQADALLPAWHPCAVRLTEPIALVIGRESDGVSEEMLHAADRRVYMPMNGFAESFNLSVATALVLLRLLDATPNVQYV